MMAMYPYVVGSGRTGDGYRPAIGLDPLISMCIDEESWLMWTTHGVRFGQIPQQRTQTDCDAEKEPLTLLISRHTPSQHRDLSCNTQTLSLFSS